MSAAINGSNMIEFMLGVFFFPNVSSGKSQVHQYSDLLNVSLFHHLEFCHLVTYRPEVYVYVIFSHHLVQCLARETLDEWLLNYILKFIGCHNNQQSALHFTVTLPINYFTTTSHNLSHSIMLFYNSFTQMMKLRFRKLTNRKS